jgi:hypothetical protein
VERYEVEVDDDEGGDNTEQVGCKDVEGYSFERMQIQQEMKLGCDWRQNKLG